MDPELLSVLARCPFGDRVQSAIAVNETASDWRGRLNSDRDSFFAYLRTLGVCKVGERLALTNALQSRVPEQQRSPDTGIVPSRKEASTIGARLRQQLDGASPKGQEELQRSMQSRQISTAEADEVDGELIICYINLPSRPDRRTAMEAALGPAGLADAHRVRALTGADAPESTVRSAWDTTLNAKFDHNCDVHSSLAMSIGERGCAASHVEQWRRCVDRGSPVLVLEDDVRFQRSSSSSSVGASVRALVRALAAGLPPAERTILLYLGADAKLRDGAPSLRGQQACWAARSAHGANVMLKEAEWAWQTVRHKASMLDPMTFG